MSRCPTTDKAMYELYLVIYAFIHFHCIFLYIFIDAFNLMVIVGINKKNVKCWFLTNNIKKVNCQHDKSPISVLKINFLLC